MITKEDIKNLAQLARIDIPDSEALSLTKEVDSILGYVGQIQAVDSDARRIIPKLRNVLRDDVVTNNSEEYTEKLLKNAPGRKENYLKVKKIL